MTSNLDGEAFNVYVIQLKKKSFTQEQFNAKVAFGISIEWIKGI